VLQQYRGIKIYLVSLRLSSRKASRSNTAVDHRRPMCMLVEYTDPIAQRVWEDHVPT